jgi:hypothetical protein
MSAWDTVPYRRGRFIDKGDKTMLSLKVIKLFIAALLLAGTTAGAAMISPGSPPPAKKNNSAAHKSHRATSVIQSFDGRTLVLKNGKRYDLTNVQVTNLSNPQKGNGIAEMSFFDHKLKEVTIR